MTRGKVSVAWSTAASGDASTTVAIGQLDVTIPAGTSGTVEIPVPDSNACTVDEGGKDVWSKGKFVKGVVGECCDEPGLHRNRRRNAGVRCQLGELQLPAQDVICMQAAGSITRASS